MYMYMYIIYAVNGGNIKCEERAVRYLKGCVGVRGGAWRCVEVHGGAWGCMEVHAYRGCVCRCV